MKQTFEKWTQELQWLIDELKKFLDIEMESKEQLLQEGYKNDKSPIEYYYSLFGMLPPTKILANIREITLSPEILKEQNDKRLRQERERPNLG